MSPDYKALCAELLTDYDNCHYRSELSDRARTELSQPEPAVLTRPDCFNFAMDFLGGTEEAEVRNYIERLESAASAAQPEPVAPTDEQLLAMRSWSCHGPTFDSDLVDFGRRCYNLGRCANAAAVLRSAADQVVPEEVRVRKGMRPGGIGSTTPTEWMQDQRIHSRRHLLAIAADLAAQ